MRVLLLATSITATLAVSCEGAVTQEDPPSPGSGTSADSSPPNAAPSAVTGYVSFTEAVQTAGFYVRHGGRTDLPGNRAVTGRWLFIDGERVSVFEFPTEAALDRARAAITRQGRLPIGAVALAPPKVQGSGRVFVEWLDPHFFSSGRLIAVYQGREQRTLQVLELVLGPQFAGL